MIFATKQNAMLRYSESEISTPCESLLYLIISREPFMKLDKPS